MFRLDLWGATPRAATVATHCLDYPDIHKHWCLEMPPWAGASKALRGALGLGDWAAGSSGRQTATTKPTKSGYGLASTQAHSAFFVPYF